LHLATHKKKAKECNEENIKPHTIKKKKKCTYDGAKDTKKKVNENKMTTKKCKKINWKKFKKKSFKFFTQMKDLGLD